VTVLVTGGAGFIGSHVVDRLCAEGLDARVFDLRRSPYHGAGVETRRGDVLDRRALRRAMRGCDAVIHLAAVADVDRVANAPDEAEEINSRGTLNVLEAAREAGVRRVVYASTVWVYSDAPSHELDEEAPLGLPAHLYTATKLAGEMYCRSYMELYDLECTILRFGIPYGPRARGEAVVPRFVSKALAGEPLSIAGDGSQSRRFVYVEDLADGVVRALAPVAANRVYNLVGDESVTVRQIADTVRSEVAPVEIVHVEGRRGDLQQSEVVGDRATNELGWRPGTSFTEGVRRYVSWHREQAVEPARRPRLERLARSSTLVRAWSAIVLATVTCAAVLLLVLERSGAGRADFRTVALTTMIGLAVSLFWGFDASQGDGRAADRARWVIAGVTVLLVLHWPHDLLRLAHTDLDLRVQALAGALLGATLPTQGRRLARAGMARA
jgi:UDP-glucose 4-epimerase